MTSAEIRQSFLDFFKSKQHTVVPSSSLLPDSPNLLFTNAGMNQFVPIFLGQTPCPYTPGRATDTQKCVRAGGKHNDLEDVGLDTYHHTFFEMLGNWSFGDYFKKDAIHWAWELIIEVWKFPANRLYTTVYNPDKSIGDPAEFDQEAWDLWAEKFRSVGLDPAVHIVNGNKKDNFWMMGETGPCGPCSELHIDLTPLGDTKGSLVNTGDARCIEIWNNVFIQFNANPDGTFSPLPAQHVDTGMGFERVCSIMQNSKGFTNFNVSFSNYETDVFRPLFDEIERLSGKMYGSTLPAAGSTGDTEQEKIDVAFRVIADHIRTLSFAIADGIPPGNNGRNYVLRRILRRAVKYGRTLGFKEPFFYKLTDVLAAHMGGVFGELREKREFIKEVLKREEELFNKTLDRGIALFEEEAARLTGRAGVRYTRHRRLPHFEKPWAIYFVTITTLNRRILSPASRTAVLNALRHFHGEHYELYAACVMPDHVHFLLQPWVKERNEKDEPVFWSLGSLMHSIKSFTAKEINKLEGTTGGVWLEEQYDRYLRGDNDLEEKFHYICRNPRRENLVGPDEEYQWIWTPDERLQSGGDFVYGERAVPNVSPGTLPEAPGKMPDAARGTPALPVSISGEFAFRLYDTYGFPLDLTELLARERGLTVDTAGFDQRMEEQKTRARAAQKKEIIELSQLETTLPTLFTGFDTLESKATVLEVVKLKDKTAVILDISPCYAEMGGQVGDTGILVNGNSILPVTATQKSGPVWLHFIGGGEEDAPLPDTQVVISVEKPRRAAIQRHHTVTHLLHWALHEVVSQDAAQKGSAVSPDKLTFDFNSGALSTRQLADIERLVNERILDNDAVSWQELPYAEVKTNPRIMQFFGDKYGETVRVVQIGGQPRALDGYSMELCGGTHARATGEIGLFRIASESAVASGIRRIEAVAGLPAWQRANDELTLLKAAAYRLNSPLAEVEKRIETMLTHQKDLEKQLRALQQQQAAQSAKALLRDSRVQNGVPLLIANLGATPPDALQLLADAVKAEHDGVAVLAATHAGSAALIALVSPAYAARFQAGKIISAISPIIGGKGGGKPDFARGGGKDVERLDEALRAAEAMF